VIIPGYEVAYRPTIYEWQNTLTVFLRYCLQSTEKRDGSAQAARTLFALAVLLPSLHQTRDTLIPQSFGNPSLCAVRQWLLKKEIKPHLICVGVHTISSPEPDRDCPARIEVCDSWRGLQR